MPNKSVNYQTVAMESLCNSITDGKHGDCQNEDASGYYFLSSKDISDGKLHYENARQITYADFQDTHRRTRLEPLDIVITNSGTIGRMAIVNDDELTQRTTFQKSVAILKPKKERINTHWLFYYLSSNKERLIAFAGGTAQKNLLLMDLRAFEIQLVPLETQHRIASVLTAYDRLIENNTRRIKILEEMAKLIYREWFVEFRAPGVKFRKATAEEKKVTGKDVFPEGWAVRALEESLEEIIDYRGKTPKKLGGEWSESGIMALSALNIKQWSLVNLEKCKFVSEDLYSMWMKTELCKGDILMTSEAPLGELYFLACEKRMCLSQRVFGLRAKKSAIDPALLFLQMSGSQFQRQLSSNSTGTTVLGIRQAQLRRIQIVAPDKESQAEFSGAVWNILELRESLQESNSRLRQTRDFLLTKLVSGEVEV